MDWFDTILGRYKELGIIGTLIIIAAKWGDKVFVWMLDTLGVKIKRAQSREDVLDAIVATMRVELDEVKEDVGQLKGAYKIVYGVAHGSADGIESELTRLKLELPTVLFYVNQLRAIQALEEVLKEFNGNAQT